MATALVAGAVVVLSFQFLTARTIARAQAFFFVQHMFTISVEAATLCVSGTPRGGACYQGWGPLPTNAFAAPRRSRPSAKPRSRSEEINGLKRLGSGKTRAITLRRGHNM